MLNFYVGETRPLQVEVCTCTLKITSSIVDPILYLSSLYTQAIHGFRETEKSHWNDDNKAILHRVREEAFKSEESQMTLVHVLDLAKDGFIKPHIDSVKVSLQNSLAS